CDGLAQAAAQGCQLALFPELRVTGYTCGDLFYQSLLRGQARAAWQPIAEDAQRHDIVVVIGLPLEVDSRLYNCAAFLCDGTIIGVVPKTYLPNTGEYYEERWFSSSTDATTPIIELDGLRVPFGADLLFAAGNVAECVIGIEVCQDLWTALPPSSSMALAGAVVLLNLSASDELLGKSVYRRELVKQQSARCYSAYLYAGSGPGESSTDIVFGGHSLIAENGVILAETARFGFALDLAIADIDLQQLVHDRLHDNSFAATRPWLGYRTLPFTLPAPPAAKAAHGGAQRHGLVRPQLSPTPFVPADPSRRAEHCEEIFQIQSTGLAKRLRHTGISRALLGLSGGLDSTLALLVILRTFDLLALPHADIVAVSMPGFGTSVRTQTNVARLAHGLGITLREIAIRAAVQRHLRDIGHDASRRDSTYENAQARERTQILMDLANQLHGLVVGTGDLSELALGWSTYNGDQMSMYHVNAGVPKTLVRYVIEWCAERVFTGETAEVLRDICATPISPELLPPPTPTDPEPTTPTDTETAIGPYVLHDFFLFYTVRYGFAPQKVFVLARQAFAGVYAPAVILRWLGVFYDRFFTYQFKRSAMPDGPKVGSVALSPRGDWRMPSDASVALWQADLARLQAVIVQEDTASGRV
ncbi:MAG: NAD(+) synthase, partial [Ktedonobacterales bacterium]